MIMVSVNVGEGKEPVVGLLIDTQLMPMQGPPKATLDPSGKLVQTAGQSGLQGFGVVATDKGFLVGPLASMTPIMNPDDIKEESDGEVTVVHPEDVPAELQLGAGRKKKGE